MNTKPKFPLLTSTRGFLAALLSAAFACALPAVHAAGTWNGGAGVSEFTNSLNWVGGVAPTSPYDGILMTGTVGTTVTFDVPTAFTTTGTALNFTNTTASFTLSGSLLTVSGSSSSTSAIRNNTAVTQTISNNIILGTGFDAGFGSYTGGGSLVLAGNIDNNGRIVGLMAYNNASVKANGVISGSGGTVVNGNAASIVELNGINSYTGTTTIYSGTVKVSHDALVSTSGSLGNASSSVVMGLSGGGSTPALLANGAVTIARDISLTTSTGAANTYTLGGSTADISTFSGVITNGTASAAAQALVVTATNGGQVNFTGNIVRATGATGTADTLTKSGSGTVVLSGVNSYSGGTFVNAGTLLVNNTSGSGAVTVNSAGTLGGTGSIAGATTIASGGNLSAGAAGSGTLTLNNSLTLASGSTTTLNIVSTNNYTAVNMGANLLTYGGALTLNNTNIWNAGDTYYLFGSSLTGATNSFSSVTLAGTWTNAFTDNAGVWSATNGGDTLTFSQANGQLAITAVPEPATYALFGFGALVLVVAYRRKKVA